LKGYDPLKLKSFCIKVDKTPEENPKRHPDFDGHMEKPILEMTPEERLDYLWTLIEFSRIVKDRKIIKRTNSNNE